MDRNRHTDEDNCIQHRRPRSHHRHGSAQNSSQPDQAKLEKMTARFAPTEITADVAKLSPNDRKVLAKTGRGFADHRWHLSPPGLGG